MHSLEDCQDRDYERFSGDLCDHGQRLKAQEVTGPQPLPKERGEVLRALLAANGGKMFAKAARQRMGVSETIFSKLLSEMSDYIEVLKLARKLLTTKRVFVYQTRWDFSLTWRRLIF